MTSPACVLLYLPVVVTRENRTTEPDNLSAIRTKHKGGPMPSGPWRIWALMRPPTESVGRSSEMLNCKPVSADLENKAMRKVLVYSMVRGITCRFPR